MELHVDGEAVGVSDEEVAGGSVGSLHPPNQPGCLQLELGEEVGKEDVVVMMGAGTGVWDGVVMEEVVVVVVVLESLQPNHPG